MVTMDRVWRVAKVLAERGVLLALVKEDGAPKTISLLRSTSSGTRDVSVSRAGETVSAQASVCEGGQWRPERGAALRRPEEIGRGLVWLLDLPPLTPEEKARCEAALEGGAA